MVDFLILVFLTGVMALSFFMIGKTLYELFEYHMFFREMKKMAKSVEKLKEKHHD